MEAAAQRLESERSAVKARQRELGALEAQLASMTSERDRANAETAAEGRRATAAEAAAAEAAAREEAAGARAAELEQGKRAAEAALAAAHTAASGESATNQQRVSELEAALSAARGNTAEAEAAAEGLRRELQASHASVVATERAREAVEVCLPRLTLLFSCIGEPLCFTKAGPFSHQAARMQCSNATRLCCSVSTATPHTVLHAVEPSVSEQKCHSSAHSKQA